MRDANVAARRLLTSRTLQRRQVAAAVPASRSGPDAIRAATLEATRPSGSQQQADLGQRGVHLPAARHRTAVNQGERRAGVTQWEQEEKLSGLTDLTRSAFLSLPLLVLQETSKNSL